jgi:hypothetical protein
MGIPALRAGKFEEAYSIFAEAAREFTKDSYTIGSAVALEGMANFYVITGKPERAARLVGWGDAVRKRVGDRRPAIEQTDMDKLISACLATMGEAEFSDAYDEGGKMQLHEVVAYALNRG